MKQKLLSLLLALTLLLALIPAAGALDLTDDKAAALAALGIMAGDENGDLNLSKQVTRAEFATMAVNAHTTGRYSPATGSTSPYFDVPASHWASGYVGAAARLGLVTGYLDGLFRPDQSITLEEGVTIVLQLLGYTTADFPGGWPDSQMTAYRALGLDEGMTAVQGQPLTRAHTQQLFYNLLTTRNKQGTYHLNALEPGLQAVSADGAVNTLVLINDAMAGPAVADSGWQSRLPFAINGNTTVYRNGVRISSSAVQAQDVLYWSAALRTVWTYSTKVTGTYTAATPSISSPSSVTVAGRTYSVAPTAQLALSDAGGARLGDTVTLLLGQNDQVAAVLTGSVPSASLVGVITATGTGTYYNASGHAYTSPTVTFTATDGGSYTYPVSSLTGYETGDLVRVTDGAVSRPSSSTLSGRFSTDGAALGNTPLAGDIQILDVYESTGKQIFPRRLAGVTLSGDDIRYWSKNAAGEIDRLVLNDVTGDLHQYGILTEVSDLSVGMSINVLYTYQVGGREMVWSSSGVKFAVGSTGPIQIKGAVDRMYALTEVKLTAAAGNTAWAGEQAYALAEDVAVYTCSNGDYYPADLAYVTAGDYTLTGWYDSPADQGGRIRIIVAR